ncbi:MAG TPA: Ppx/GppA phosphatase family protein [Friedmanniella sp.]
MSRTVAAFDCGTNSLRLLLADPGPGGPGEAALTDLDRQTEIVRLGQGVDATGEFAPEALQRTFAVTRSFAERVRSAGVPVERIRFVATSASRDARNRDEFFSGIEELLGVRPDVITGGEEARLSFAGALSRIRPDTEPVLVMDIGGGSTELIVGDASGTVASAISLDIGSVRLTERFLRSGPPTDAALQAARERIDALLDTSGVDFGAVGTWIGVAGTATTLAGVHLQLEAYDRERVHGSTISLPDLAAMSTRLTRMSVDEIKALPSMHPGRADVVTAGALIASCVAARLKVTDLVVSESDILDGIALQLLHSSGAA